MASMRIHFCILLLLIAQLLDITVGCPPTRRPSGKPSPGKPRKCLTVDGKECRTDCARARPGLGPLCYKVGGGAGLCNMALAARRSLSNLQRIGGWNENPECKG